MDGLDPLVRASRPGECFNIWQGTPLWSIGIYNHGWPGPSGQGFKAWRMSNHLVGGATLEYRDRQPWMAWTLWSGLQGLEDASISGRGIGIYNNGRPGPSGQGF